MMEQKKAGGLAAIALTVLILLAAVLGPEQMARYKDRSALNEITFEETENLNQGYRYILSSNEKLYLLSECLSRQVLPESELSAVTRAETGDADMGYEGLMGSYAFVTNRQGPSGVRRVWPPLSGPWEHARIPYTVQWYNFLPDNWSGYPVFL